MFGDTRGATDGFFSSIKGSIASGADKLFNEIVPVWVANELQVQTQDQLKNPVYNSEFAEPKLSNYPSTTESATNQKAGLLFDNVNVSGTALLGVAVAAVIGIAIARL